MSASRNNKPIATNRYIATTDGKKICDYSQKGSEGYTIPDVNLNDPANRRVKVISVGCGLSTIMNSYYMQKELENIEHVAYEKNSDIGGTWFENTYPGCACDIPAHAYSMLFALNPNWSKLLATREEIWEYLNKVCEVFDLKKNMVFYTEVIGLYWQEGKWLVKLRQNIPGQESREFEDSCDIILYAKGYLNSWSWPKIPGLDKFKGKVIHSAGWDKDYTEEKWANDRVAVIGTGASSIQIVPQMQPKAKHIDIFARTGVWFSQIREEFADNFSYTEEEKEGFRADPNKLVAVSKDLDSTINRLWTIFFEDNPLQGILQKEYGDRMKRFFGGDERLYQGFKPDFPIGCRRITPGDAFMKALTKENVDAHFTGVASVTEDGVVGDDGIERKCDTIICATGFDTTWRPQFPIIGKNGVNLQDKWANETNGYLGLAAPGDVLPEIPNFVIFVGPAWPVTNGSISGPLTQVTKYAIQCIRKMQTDNIKSWAPKQSVTDKFNQHVQEWYKYTIWKNECRSWFKNQETGRIHAVWPGSALHYREAITKVRWEDMEIDYHEDNMWGLLGLGYTLSDRYQEKYDLSPYVNLEAIDPKWLEAMGSPVKEPEDNLTPPKTP
ncbi:unnamed protein product [Clonostachys solani]|uniref:Sterigmatocystin biosynthesis monooxygenase stcW n=1 Tax=Clonostachys solani TaxID=160281 RepID=A0A9N9W7F4_9HYPO|nr:unnamed protein product [Clonostachys solani]